MKRLIHIFRIILVYKYIYDKYELFEDNFNFTGISDEDFLRRKKRAGIDSLDDSAYEQSMYEQVQKLLAEKLKTDLDNVNVLSVMYNATADSTDVRFAAHGSPWYQSSRLDGIVSTNLGDVSIIQASLSENV